MCIGMYLVIVIEMVGVEPLVYRNNLEGLVEVWG